MYSNVLRFEKNINVSVDYEDNRVDYRKDDAIDIRCKDMLLNKN